MTLLIRYYFNCNITNDKGGVFNGGFDPIYDDRINNW